MPTRVTFFCVATFAFLHAATVPAGFQDTQWVTGISAPTAMAFAPDGRLFVCQQGGAVRVIKNGQLLGAPFVTLTVNAAGERGLLGIAFDPNFASNQYLYVYYTATSPAIHNRISRFTANGDLALPNSELTILDLNNLSSATNHNGGAIHFGPDGKLYVAVGENAIPSNAQSLNDLFGKILRINTDPANLVPADNPFVNDALGVNRVIWALGLRNPFTFAFQRGTGRMFINDVGQNTAEEINDGAAGANYGWPDTEGNDNDPRYVGPTFAYAHGAGPTVGNAITGGTFYNPTTLQFPPEYVGRYFFADFTSGWVRQLNPTNNNTVTGFASGYSDPVDLKVGPDGALYVLARDAGAVHRVISTQTQPPTPLRFVPVTPCRVADTRNAAGPFGGPNLSAASPRDLNPRASTCGIPANAQAYSLNLTVVPLGPLGFLSAWPAGQGQPSVSTLNSTDGRIRANAAIVPAGTNGAITLFASHPAHVIVDINGYFVPAIGNNNLAFYPLTPCRIADTRAAAGAFGAPSLAASQVRTFPLLSSACGIPSTAQAYALNLTVAPPSALGFLSAWPTGSPQPLVSTLNSGTGAITANAAIVPAGTSGAINVFATHATDLIIDINGYFAPPGAGGMQFYPVTPCRVSDTRDPAGPFGGPQLVAAVRRDFVVTDSACGIPANAAAYSLNATVVPPAGLGFLSLWGGGGQPGVSTLNAGDGAVVANAALVPASNTGSVSALASHATHLILDINGYFAQ